eukprot:314616-Pyramimonas_sp.AAC.1
MWTSTTRNALTSSVRCNARGAALLLAPDGARPAKGAPLIGTLEKSGTGTEMAHKPLISAEEILRGRRARASAGARLLLPGPPPRRAPANARDRKALFKRTRPSPCDEALHEGALADASAGRLTTPRRLSPDDVPPDAAVIPRFGVEQGTRPDGTAKVPRRPPAPLIRGPPPARQVRAVDDCSAAHLNKGTEPQERMKHDTVDALFDACRKLARRVSRAPTPRALCP